jgi:hypothetical protein
MAKYYGSVGYAETVETKPGVWRPTITEKSYQMDVLRRNRRWENSGYLNDNVTISNEVSLIADPYAFEHLGDIRYVSFLGTKWKVTAVELTPPRIKLSVGGVYNEEQT